MKFSLSNLLKGAVVFHALKAWLTHTNHTLAAQPGAGGPLTDEQVRALTPAQIAAMSTDALNALTVIQFSSLSAAQAGAMTAVQLPALEIGRAHV